MPREMQRVPAMNFGKMGAAESRRGKSASGESRHLAAQKLGAVGCPNQVVVPVLVSDDGKNGSFHLGSYRAIRALFVEQESVGIDYSRKGEVRSDFLAIVGRKSFFQSGVLLAALMSQREVVPCRVAKCPQVYQRARLGRRVFRRGRKIVHDAGDFPFGLGEVRIGVFIEVAQRAFLAFYILVVIGVGEYGDSLGVKIGLQRERQILVRAFGGEPDVVIADQAPPE